MTTKDKARIVALRLLIGWWMIPATWVLVFPIICMITGEGDMSVEACKEISRTMWWGE